MRVRTTMTVLSAAGIAALLTGCAGTTTVTETLTQTATVTATVTATPAADPAEASEEPADPYADLFDKGYPKVVDISDVPDYMRSTIEGEKAVAIAPGVWTDYVEGIDPVDLAVDGSPFGMCAAVSKWERTLVGAGFDTQGNTCW